MEKLFQTTLFVCGLVAVLLGIGTLTDHKLSKLKEYALTNSDKNYVSAKERTRQLECLARNIYYEAGVEPFEGKVAVAQVTINRSKSGKFPVDICQVIYQKNVVFERVICQFSWYCEHATIRRPVNSAVYNESMEVAKKVLLEDFRISSVNTALFYHADYVNPGWGKKPITKIGRHIFYE
jgi:spore germination cell wall hydrolase CwlJ-like protein